MSYDLIDIDTGEHIKGVLGTPLLISEATAPGQHVEAFKEQDYRPEVYPGGLWRVRDDRRDPAGTQYRRVRMIVIEEHDPLAGFAQ